MLSRRWNVGTEDFWSHHVPAGARSAPASQSPLFDEFNIAPKSLKMSLWRLRASDTHLTK